jgi:hypothetical protein
VREWFAAVLDVFPDWHPRPAGRIVSFGIFRTEADAIEALGLDPACVGRDA